MNDRPSYPWSEGDALFASELNAAIANAGAAVTVPPGGSIQAALDALPAAGGEVRLSPDTVYVITTPIVSSKPNVHLFAPGWGTVLKHDPSLAELMINLTGAGCIVEGFTVDGNSVVGTHFEIYIQGANSIVRGMHFINSMGTADLGLAGQNSRATGNTITGTGAVLSTERGYGVWAESHATVMIDHNTITGCGVSAIGIDGEGSQVIGNFISGCHTWTTAGGQIFVSSAGTGANIVIADNTMGPGGGAAAYGIEIWRPSTVVTGNTIEGQQGAGIIAFVNGAVITGNSIRNCGAGANAVLITGNVSDFVISGNRIADDRTPVLTAYGIYISAGSSDRYSITGNILIPNATLAIFLGGTGITRAITNNIGIADVPGVPTVNAANDAAAAAGGVPVGGEYRNGSIKMVRVT